MTSSIPVPVVVIHESSPQQTELYRTHIGQLTRPVEVLTATNVAEALALVAVYLDRAVVVVTDSVGKMHHHASRWEFPAGKEFIFMLQAIKYRGLIVVGSSQSQHRQQLLRLNICNGVLTKDELLASLRGGVIEAVRRYYIDQAARRAAAADLVRPLEARPDRQPAVRPRRPLAAADTPVAGMRLPAGCSAAEAAGIVFPPH